MKMNRNHNQIINQVLEIAQVHTSASDLILKTRSNHPRIKKITSLLIDKQLLVKFKKNYVITEKGRVVLENWKKFNNLAESFGLEI